MRNRTVKVKLELNDSTGNYRVTNITGTIQIELQSPKHFGKKKMVSVHDYLTLEEANLLLNQRDMEVNVS